MAEKKGVCAIIPRHQDGCHPKVIGMGILVNDREVVTCAHVVDMAIEEGWFDRPGDGIVRVCFPYVDGSVCVNGTVDRERYFRPERAEEGKLTDIAVIQLSEPAPKSAGAAVLQDHVDDASVTVFGYRQKELLSGDWGSHPNGEINESKVVGALPGGRVHFEGIRSTGATVEPGFSGAGVYDPRQGAVIGMVVTASAEGGKNSAQFIDVRSLLTAIRRQSGVSSTLGYGKAHSYTNPKKSEWIRLPATNPLLIGREKQLQDLDEAWSARTKILVLVAWGGVGKTALVNRWLNGWDAKGREGVERVFGWSFYSQGERDQASGDAFLAEALEWFGDGASGQLPPRAKGKRLAELIREQPTLLILDGLEPLQYSDPLSRGRLKDPGVSSMLTELAHDNPGFCLITTRLSVVDLAKYQDGRVVERNLENLSTEAGVELLRKLDVIGDSRDLRAAVDEYEGHALALTLLGTYLKDACEGKVARRNELGPLEKAENPLAAHAWRVMRSYENWLKEGPELAVLRLLGLFDRPADSQAVVALRDRGVIPNLPGRDEGDARWQQALSRLRRLRLLSDASTDNSSALDSHPLVREHFGLELRDNHREVWRRAHKCLFEHYRNRVAGQPKTLADMTWLFLAVAHGCQAGHHQEALDAVYWPRISQKDKHYSTTALGAFSADLAALSGFFDKPFSIMVDRLGDQSKCIVSGVAGFDLRALGRLEEAISPLTLSYESAFRLKDWDIACRRAGNLSKLYLTLGKFEMGRLFAELCMAFGNCSKDGYWRMASRPALADYLHQAGDCKKAEELFQEGEKLQGQYDPEHPLLATVRGYQYCDLLLTLNRDQDAAAHASATLRYPVDKVGLLSAALDHLVLGRVELAQGQQENLSKAEEHLTLAVEKLDDAHREDYRPLGFLALAALERRRKNTEPARRHLAEAREIAARGKMQLHLTDCDLEQVQQFFASGQREKAQELLKETKNAIETIGYRRRDGEIAEIEKALRS